MRLAILTMQSCLRATGRQAGRIGRQARTVCRPRQVALRVGRVAGRVVGAANIQ